VTSRSTKGFKLGTDGDSERSQGSYLPRIASSDVMLMGDSRCLVLGGGKPFMKAGWEGPRTGRSLENGQLVTVMVDDHPNGDQNTVINGNPRILLILHRSSIQNTANDTPALWPDAAVMKTAPVQVRRTPMLLLT
jgi:hypothetical protein